MKRENLTASGVQEFLQNAALQYGDMATCLKVHKCWLDCRTRQTGEGTIPQIRIEKYLRFNESDVMAWIKEKYGETRNEVA